MLSCISARLGVTGSTGQGGMRRRHSSINTAWSCRPPSDDAAALLDTVDPESAAAHTRTADMTEYKSKSSLEKLAKALQTNQSLQKETHEKLNADVVFEISGKGLKTPVVWLLRSKDAGGVQLATAEGERPPADITIRVDDVNLRKLIHGKQSAQKLFMTGKLKIKGNVMKASYIEKLLKFAGPEKAKL